MAAAKKKYGALASESVEREMKAMKAGKLKSSSGDKVTNPKQAIAIGLSEARRAGGKVPPPPAAAKKATPKKATASKAAAEAKPTSPKKAAVKKATPKKASATKSVGKS